MTWTAIEKMAAEAAISGAEVGDFLFKGSTGLGSSWVYTRWYSCMVVIAVAGI